MTNRKHDILSITKISEKNVKNLSKKSCGRLWMQYVIAVTVSLVYMMDGSQAAWAGPTMLHLKEINAPVSPEEMSWLASTNILGYTFGPILGAIGGNLFGRRRCILLAMGPIVFGILLTGFVESILVKCIGRFVAGVSIASAYTIIPLYLGEVSTPEIRGKLTYFLMIGYNCGLFFEYAVGAYTSIQINGVILATVPVLFFIIFWWMPESPYFLVMKQRTDEAKNVLNVLNVTDNINEKIESIKTFISEQDLTKGPSVLFRSKCNRKALFITLAITSANILTGINATLAYAPTIFAEANSGFSVNASSMIFAASGILVIGVSSLLIDTWGRRPLLLISTASTAVPLLTLGTYFYLQHINFVHLSTVALVPVISIIMVKFCMSIGLSNIQYICMGEMFPTNITPIAACVVETFASIGRFSVTKSYQILTDMFSIYVVFWGFGICCILNTILLTVIMPETKNQSLETIQEKFRGKSKKNSSLDI